MAMNPFQHRRLKWPWDWRVTLGVFVGPDLVPVFLFDWEQRSPPPWARP